MEKIPKIIHYCWIGPAEKPASVLYCIETWKKFCPDYKIVEWNEKNYDFSKNPYMKQAYEAKKWGFVPDYARLDIIYEYGGFYLDTDVELLRSLDEISEYEAVMGFENTGDGEFFVNCGHGFGAVPKHYIIKKARDLYENVSFMKNDGTLNLTPSPVYTTQTLRQFGLIQENRRQKLSNMTVFESEVFCPKNFRTGVISSTKNTVSIHHFTASWMDEKIKKDLERQQKLKKKYGEKIASLILYVESVCDKYSLNELILKIPLKLVNSTKKKCIELIDAIPYYYYLLLTFVNNNNNNKIAILDTALNSDNAGDSIIMKNCISNLNSVIQVAKCSHYPTHTFPSQDELKQLSDSSLKILCGTNILSGTMRNYGLWKIGANIRPYKNTLLMGVGFDSDISKSDTYTKLMFKIMLNHKMLHSVRDSFSEKKLKEMGIKNVINTGCPTMWSLSREHCKNIPVVKAKDVVCTLTDYCKNEEIDKIIMEILFQCYENVYFWIQGENDLLYLNELGFADNVIVIDNELSSYEALLNQDNLDYVGTRLHAGIYALSFLHRSIIISIDNRATAISIDTGLPIVKREDVPIYLKEKIESDIITSINLPVDNINKWLEQFKPFGI